jgi:hypothetical protein
MIKGGFEHNPNLMTSLAKADYSFQIKSLGQVLEVA